MMELSQKYYMPPKFNENLNLSTTNLGRIDMTRSDKIKGEERFPTSEQGYTVGKL